MAKNILHNPTMNNPDMSHQNEKQTYGKYQLGRVVISRDSTYRFANCKENGKSTLQQPGISLCKQEFLFKKLRNS
jgi:hypothetical protein